MRKNAKENAKDPAWRNAPKGLSGVSPQDYDKSIGSALGSAQGEKYTGSSDSASELTKEEQKKRGQYPRHDEKIGGA